MVDRRLSNGTRAELNAFSGIIVQHQAEDTRLKIVGVALQEPCPALYTLPCFARTEFVWSNRPLLYALYALVHEYRVATS